MKEHTDMRTYYGVTIERHSNEMIGNGWIAYLYDYGQGTVQADTLAGVKAMIRERIAS